MKVAGIDIGSLSAKALIMSDNEILGWAIIRTTPDSARTASQVLEAALHSCGFHFEDLEYIVSTGYGRIRVPFANKHFTEISCHARGTVWAFPDVRTIVDMGGQDCKAIRCDPSGRVTNFVLNEKCAAGTGRFLERTAAILGVPLEEIGPRSLEIVEKAVHPESFCAVFAQRDIIVLRQQGKAINDILAGVHEDLVRRISLLINKVGLVPKLSVSGGIAKNLGIIKGLEKYLNMEVLVWQEPQVIGALGAALFAREAMSKRLP